jgi:hypothetical protein
MSDDNTQDTNEPSPASAGSHGSPVAWGVFYGDGKLHSSWDSHAKAECTALTMRKFDHLGVYVSPLYRSPTLTDEERTFLRMVRDTYAMQDDDEVCGMIAASITGLLDRTK